MDAGTIALLTLGTAVFALLWKLRMDLRVLREDLGEDISNVREALGRDLGDLHVRVSRIESMLAGAGLKVSSDSAPG